jgi:hypothetical protein
MGTLLTGSRCGVCRRGDKPLEGYRKVGRSGLPEIGNEGKAKIGNPGMGASSPPVVMAPAQNYELFHPTGNK